MAESMDNTTSFINATNTTSNFEGEGYRNDTMGRKNAQSEPVNVDDPTAWILDNGFAEFVLMHTNEIVSLLCCTHSPIWC